MSIHSLFTGKTTFFVANQATLEDVPAEKLKQLEEEYKNIEDANKLLAADIRAASTGMMHASIPSLTHLRRHS